MQFVGVMTGAESDQPVGAPSLLAAEINAGQLPPLPGEVVIWYPVFISKKKKETTSTVMNGFEWMIQ